MASLALRAMMRRAPGGVLAAARRGGVATRCSSNTQPPHDGRLAAHMAEARRVPDNAKGILLTLKHTVR